MAASNNQTPDPVLTELLAHLRGSQDEKVDATLPRSTSPVVIVGAMPSIDAIHVTHAPPPLIIAASPPCATHASERTTGRGMDALAQEILRRSTELLGLGGDFPGTSDKARSRRRGRRSKRD